MEILRVIGAFAIYCLMFLYFAMPMWLLLLVTNVKYGKKSDEVITLSEEKLSLYKHLYSKNKYILINSVITLIILGIGYSWLRNGMCEGGTPGCFSSAVMSIPVILSFLLVGITLFISILSSVTKYYYPNQKRFVISKKVKIIIISIIILYLAYNLFGSKI